MHQRLVPAVLIAGLLIPAAAFAKQMDPASYALMRLDEGARCDDPASPWRPWCVADKLRDGTAAPLPIGKVLVGYTVELDRDDDGATALRDHVSLSALTIGGTTEAPKVKLLGIKPTTDAERTMTAQAIGAITLVFKDKALTATLPTELRSYLKTLAADRAVTKAGTAWSWSSPGPAASSTELTKVGAVWVAIEIGPRPKAAAHQRHAPMPTIWITILTEAWN